MPKFRKVAATTTAVVAAGMGVQAYKAHESANDIRTQAAIADATYQEPTLTARIEALADRKDLQFYSLLGGAALLGLGTFAAYRGTAPENKPSGSNGHHNAA